MKRLVGLVLVLCLGPTVRGQSSPAQKEWEQLRAHGQGLLKALEGLKQPLPAATDKALRALVSREVKDAEGAGKAGEELQELLDALCLVHVNINPESRVKAERGASPA